MTKISKKKQEVIYGSDNIEEFMGTTIPQLQFYWKQAFGFPITKRTNPDNPTSGSVPSLDLAEFKKWAEAWGLDAGNPRSITHQKLLRVYNRRRIEDLPSGIMVPVNYLIDVIGFPPVTIKGWEDYTGFPTITKVDGRRCINLRDLLLWMDKHNLGVELHRIPAEWKRSHGFLKEPDLRPIRRVKSKAISTVIHGEVIKSKETADNGTPDTT